jgi:hypothetical protein
LLHELQLYYEPLDTGELDFLKRKEARERRQYYRAFRLLMFLSFIIPFSGAWYRAYDGAPNAFSIIRFFVSAAILLFMSVTGTYISYRIHLHKIQSDIKYKTKTIETSHITRKQYMPQNNTYYFYINSPNKLSIEVSQKDFHRMKDGDEVNIEYTTHAKMYLGYF